MQLYAYNRAPQPRTASLSLRRLIYHNIDDISRLIDPTSQLCRLSSASATRALQEPVQLAITSKPDDLDGDVAMRETLESSASATKIASVSFEEHQKSRIIQRVCRRAMQRQQDRKTAKGISAIIAHLFLECLSKSRTIKWTQRRYRFVFLGALPHIMFSVDWAISRAKDVRNSAKERRSAGASDEQLEESMGLQTKAR